MKPLLPAILLIGLIVGCGGNDERPVKMPNDPTHTKPNTTNTWPNYKSKSPKARSG